MHSLRLLLVISVIVSTLANCKKDNNTDPTPTAASQTALLVANNWRTVRVTTPTGTEINKSRLSLSTQILYDLNMQFRDNGTVRALDPNQSNTVINGGTWVLATDFQSINVNVTGFNGNFPIVQLSKTKLILRQQAPVDGKTTDINLEFDPVI